jgi:hypothetical protein
MSKHINLLAGSFGRHLVGELISSGPREAAELSAKTEPEIKAWTGLVPCTVAGGLFLQADNNSQSLGQNLWAFGCLLCRTNAETTARFPQ